MVLGGEGISSTPAVGGATMFPDAPGTGSEPPLFELGPKVDMVEYQRNENSLNRILAATCQVLLQFSDTCRMILVVMNADEQRELREYNAANDRRRFARMMAIKRWRGPAILSYGFPSPEERSERMREIGKLSPRKGRPRTVAHQEGPKCRCVTCRRERCESPYNNQLKGALFYLRF